MNLIKLLLISLLISAAYMAFSTQNAYLAYDWNRPFTFEAHTMTAAVLGSNVHIYHNHMYRNPQNRPVDAYFHFPQTENEIFSKVRVKIGSGDEVTKVFEEVNDPNQKYDQVAGTGERFLDKFISVGKVGEREIVAIMFTVTKPLKLVLNKYYELEIPAIFPKYDPDVIPQWEMWRYWKISLEINSERPFTLLSNPTHHLKPKLSQRSAARSSSGVVYTAYYEATVDIYPKFKLYFASEEINSPQAIITTDTGNPRDHYFMFSLIPSIGKLPYDDFEEVLKESRDIPDQLLKIKRTILQSSLRSFPNEYLFLIDRNDSIDPMYFELLQEALKTLLGFLSNQASYFRILSFGSSLELYDDGGSSYKLPEQTKQIIEWIDTLKADMGKQDLVGALEYAFKKYEWTSLSQNVIILMDSKYSGYDEVLDPVAENSHSRKICAVGFGRPDSEFLIKSIGDAGRCLGELSSAFHHEETLLNIMMSSLSTPGFNLAYEIQCKNFRNEIVHQEEAGYEEIEPDQAFTKWIPLKNIPDLKSCKARVFYYNKHRCYSSENEIELFRSEARRFSESWQIEFAHSKLKEKLNVQKKERKESGFINSTELSEPRSSYNIYKEQFQRLSCDNSTMFSLFNTSGNPSKPHQNQEGSSLSFEMICIAAVCILLFVLGYFIILK